MSEDTRADAAAETTSETTAENHLLCQCCEPGKPLVPKLDMGQTTDGRAKIAICIYHKPDKSVYVLNETDGKYELRDDLEARGAQIVVKETGEPFGQTEAPPSLLDLEVDDEVRPEPEPDSDPTPPDSGDSRPATGPTRTDLEGDGFY
ncbi:hypothetical protein C0580_04915 [Candidatus Parcubacteria bacterium]|mgnify:CR=1 FL=1|nr:MAG: hypothetical protein C0580_04915 [Candidatus Parcubacteria bacterium]